MKKDRFSKCHKNVGNNIKVSPNMIISYFDFLDFKLSTITSVVLENNNNGKINIFTSISKLIFQR